MSEIFLHHYPNSPFAEKVRLVLGYKNLAWKSVIIPDISPKPDLTALTGGYRKTPVMQVGSDIYCDTALICDVLEHLHPVPSLYPAVHKGLARIIAQWADEKVFWAAMAYNLGPKGSAQVLGRGRAPEVWMPEAKVFAEDRNKMRMGAPRLPGADATAAYKSYLRRISTLLEDQEFVMGDAPCLADFSVYHPLWFTRRVSSVMVGILDATPAVLHWMDRMEAFGHGRKTDSNAAESIASCGQGGWGNSIFGQEKFQDEHGIELGSEVTVAAESFGLETTRGTLVSATRTYYTLRRTDERAGVVQVHFPRIGYILKKADA